MERSQYLSPETIEYGRRLAEIRNPLRDVEAIFRKYGVDLHSAPASDAEIVKTRKELRNRLIQRYAELEISMASVHHGNIASYWNYGDTQNIMIDLDSHGLVESIRFKDVLATLRIKGGLEKAKPGELRNFFNPPKNVSQKTVTGIYFRKMEPSKGRILRFPA